MATATQNGFSKTQGFVEQVKRNEGRTALKIDDKWFSTFGTCNVEQGDEVELSYVVKEKGDRVYRNIKSVEPVNPAPATTAGTSNHTTDRDSQINRAVALKSAVAWAKGVETVPQVLTAADAFLNWLQGDSEQPDYSAEKAIAGDDAPF